MSTRLPASINVVVDTTSDTHSAARSPAAIVRLAGSVGARSTSARDKDGGGWVSAAGTHTVFSCQCGGRNTVVNGEIRCYIQQRVTRCMGRMASAATSLPAPASAQPHHR